MLHEQRALVGYVHPFDSVPDPAKDDPLTSELPADVALGKVDYIEVLGFSDHKSTAEVWYKLLNCGFRIPTGAGTDAMANFASLRGPVGTGAMSCVRSVNGIGCSGAVFASGSKLATVVRLVYVDGTGCGIKFVPGAMPTVVSN